MVSQAKGQVLKDMDGFTFDDKAGQDTRVYIIDSGLETTSPVSMQNTSSQDHTKTHTQGIQRS